MIQVLALSPQRPRWQKLEFAWLNSLDQISELEKKCIVVAGNLVDLKAYLSKGGEAEYCFVFSSSSASTDDLLNFQNETRLFSVFTDWESSAVEKKILQALELHQVETQNLNLEKTILDESLKLEKYKVELENRIEKRQNFLLESRRKAFLAHTQLEVLKQIILLLQQAKNLSEMEQQIDSVLKSTHQLHSIRIMLSPQDDLFLKKIVASHSWEVFPVSLYSGEKKMGAVFFLREKGLLFLKQDQDLFRALSESLSLVVSRWIKYDQALNLQRQWQGTFNSINSPAIILNRDYKVLQMNSSAQTFSASNHQNQFSEKLCYQLLFGRSSPCIGCKMGERFSVMKNRDYIEVKSSPMDADQLFNIYTNRSDRRELEGKILQNAKLADLGLIGSSLAHELNNPLAAISSFTQLALMDLPDNSTYKEDLLEIKNGVARSQEIVDRLLLFAFIGDQKKSELFDFEKMLKKILDLIELKSRPLGLVGSFKVSLAKPLLIKGSESAYFQAFKPLLQNAIERLLAEMASEPDFQPRLEIELREQDQNAVLTILENSTDKHTHIEKSYTLLFSAALQMVTELGCKVESKEGSKGLKVLKIQLPSPDHSQIFDSTVKNK